ncbi:hypothetical protein BIY26_01975 [Brenneria goodwinii]|uniref:Lipoprotein n=1 Tax=Brenneria goodwinii TaxID=1109412 RepID=A0A0G4JPH4_9GAMM|nr:hypothetical protein [Brenneria goodwinii]ATA24852.1 hypothetical protein AWC36_12420 [Brenneria goodwinii]MCG8156965.1 hypothetical protein [Brenneria goodwinii]MCG8161550.1 hypothetical protein [Brenneria goodwinii]MCG8165561.1 hypothetical protein [Brenneria goodwinii]MCG8170049.1 hypothetical protein [Brenneria goodwinii]
MNNKLKLAAAAFAVSLLAGCSSYNTSQPTSALVGNVESTVKADIQVGEKIQGEATANVLMGFIKWGEGDNYVDGVSYGTGSSLSFADSSASVKSAATYNAVKAAGADLIVAPRYEVTTKSYGVFKQIHVVVRGYKGTIVSVK